LFATTAPKVNVMALPLPMESTHQPGIWIVDFADLLERLGDDEPLALELLEIFYAVLDEQGKEISAAMAMGDPGAISAAAHALKGAANNVGAKALGLSCMALELKAKQVDEAAAFHTLWLAVQQAIQELQTYYRNTILPYTQQV